MTAAASGPHTRRNRLAGESSPYLLQHAANPVDWYPWGEAAFARARAEDRPLLLSIGYSSCHWCHVMAHECFEDDQIAALMNAGFVNVKVDREERPDVDAVYMTATQALSGQGGWPMTVFATPEGKPFYAGTYFPPRDSGGRPGFPRVLESVRHAWEHDRTNLLASADRITERLRAGTERTASGPGEVGVELPAQAVAQLRAAHDPVWGGFGGAPKFPSPTTLEFLLAHHARTGDTEARAMVLHTLRRMAHGGIFDQLGGGFARYSVDERWLVPHFEKMLYDNAQLVRAYLHAFQLTRDPLYERVARETLAYLQRELLQPEGGFSSAQDADSEGSEGKYFLWTLDELRETLGEDAAFAATVYGVDRAGNFADPHHPELTGRSVLSLPRELSAVAAEHGLTEDALAARLDPLRRALLARRAQRVPPGLDDKVLASWNGLALAAFAEAGRVLGDAAYLDVAKRNAAFVRARLWRDGRLLHAYRDGVAKIDGLLEDYACYGLGLVELYRACGDLAHLDWARALLAALVERFRDAAGGGCFDTPADGERLVLRQKPLFDAATPSGNGAAAQLAFWLARYDDRAPEDPQGERLAREVVALAADQLLRAPSGFGSIWQAVELLLAPRREVAIVGGAAARAPLERELARHFLPALVIAPAERGGGLPLLAGRDGDGADAAAYVCEQLACRLPVTTPEALAAALGA